MRIFASPRPGRCASCEGIIPGRPTYRMDEAYCCFGCAEGGPCVCNYEADLADDGVDHLGLLAPIDGVAATEPEATEPVPPDRRRTDPLAVPGGRR